MGSATCLIRSGRCSSRSTLLGALVLLAALVAGCGGASSVATLTVNPGRVLSAPGAQPLGVGVDGHGRGEIAQINTAGNERAMLSRTLRSACRRAARCRSICSAARSTAGIRVARPASRYRTFRLSISRHAAAWCPCRLGRLPWCALGRAAKYDSCDGLRILDGGYLRETRVEEPSDGRREGRAAVSR